MAILESKEVKKLQRERGLYSGKPQAVTGEFYLTAGQSIATTDTMHALIMGQDTRPHRVIIQFIPTSGTPVLTNPTFAVGAKQLNANTYTDSRGKTYPALTTSATSIVASMVLDADDMKQDIEVQRPVADSVSGYAPYYLTVTPAGAGAFSVAGGNGTLKITVEFLGEEDPTSIYNEYVNQKVKN